MSWRLGLDVGSATVKAVLLDPAGALRGWRLEPAGADGAERARRLGESLCTEAGLASPPSALATGYGRARVEGAARTVTEITCQARGIRHLHPAARTILDIGGQDSKAIRLADDGGVEDFSMNDRCAAGTGSFLEAVARRLGLTLEALGNVPPPEAPPPVEISATCVVFAESEIVGLLAAGHARDAIVAGVLQSLAARAAILLRQVDAKEPLYFCGGVARNEALRQAIEHALGLPLLRAEHAPLTAALGAALLA